MKKLLLVLLTAVVATCSTAHLTATAASAGSEPAGIDLSGRWIGKWTGTGLLMAPREDATTLDLVQRGDTAYGRFVIDGAAAAESVAYEVRTAGLSGIRVWAKIKRDKVTVRHEAGGHLFTADLKMTPDGEHLYGVIRGGSPKVILVFSRASDGPTPAPPQTAKLEATPPAEQLAKVEPAPKVTVMAPPEQKDETPPPPREENFINVAELAPIHFDFDRAELRKDALDTLKGHLAWLRDHPDAVLLIEGHCDERGTDEYNVALGERRAKSVSELLATQGISPDRISTTSLGRERPICSGTNEDCRMKNRRAEFRVKTR